MKDTYHKLLSKTANHPLLKIGIKKDTSTSDEKTIYLVNIICVLHIISFVLAIVIGYFFNKRLIGFYPLIGYLLITTLTLTVFVLHHYKKYFLAKTFFIFSSFLTCFIFDVYILPDLNNRFFYITPVLVSLIIYKSKIPPLLFLSLGILLFNDIFHFKNGVDLDNIHLTLLFLITFFITYFLIATNENSEKKLFQQQEELEKLHEFKSHFFINLSHEIRTPLTLIKGYTNRLDFTKSIAYNNEQKTILDQQIDEIQSIVDTIMDMGKIDESKLILNLNSVNLNSFLQIHFNQFKHEFEKKGIEFKLLLPKEQCTITCDTTLFSKSINNLLNNALKFTPKQGCVILEVNIKDSLEISVKDSGIGIPENELDNIFERYYQVKNDITASKGTGIGLSFTKNIIDAHNFKIRVDSSIKKKTCFTISIPKERFKITNTNPIEAVKESTKDVTPQKQKTILVVDDHEQMRNYIGDLLNQYNIEYAENGKEALEIINSNTIDLIVTDYMMPEMDGYELVHNLKNQGNKTPIIVITASKNDQQKLHMLRLGIDGYLNKPFLEEELSHLVEKSLRYLQIIQKTESDLSNKTTNLLDTKNQEWIESLQTEIQSGISLDSFGVIELAEKLNISKSSLNRKTKLLLGQTPNELIIEARVLKAIDIQTQNPSMSQRDLAKAVGLKNASYLIKRIKNYN